MRVKKQARQMQRALLRGNYFKKAVFAILRGLLESHALLGGWLSRDAGPDLAPSAAASNPAGADLSHLSYQHSRAIYGYRGAFFTNAARQ